MQKKIAGVSVNLNSLPTKETIIYQALKTKEFRFKRNAKVLIEKEIKASGVFNKSKRKSTKPKAKRNKTDRGLDNNKQSEHNQPS